MRLDARAAVLALLLVVGAGLGARSMRSADACAVVGPRDVTAMAVDEEAIIIWDAESGVEHFIRRTSFETEASDLGFLVPTPTQPELAEVSGEVFGRLAEVTAAQTRHRYGIDPTPVICLCPPSLSRVRGERGVEVLAVAEVAGYAASVLKAADAGALAAWLGANGYLATPAVEAWLAAYVEQGWVITAFKLAREGGRIESGTVRMSFETDRPFFPYREPEGQSDPEASRNYEERALRLWVIGDGRFHAMTDAERGRDPWTKWRWYDGLAARREIGYAAPLPGLASILDGVAPAGAVSDDDFVTLISDRAWERPSDSDLWLSKPEDQSEHVLTVWHTTWIPGEILAFLIFLVLFWLRRRRRAAAQDAEEVAS